MKIFIVEDSRAIRHVLVRRLEQLPGAHVVGEAENEAQALALIGWTEPDTVLLDLHLAQGGLGLNVLRQLRRQRFDKRILVISHQALDAYREACAAAGADGFYDKGNDVDRLCDDLALLIAGAAEPPVEASVDRLHQLVETAEDAGLELGVFVIQGLASLPGALGQPGNVLIRLSPDQLCLVVAAHEAAAIAQSLQATDDQARIGLARFPADAIGARSLLSLARARAAGVAQVA